MTTASAKKSHGSDSVTSGIRVVVFPTYLPDHSEPAPPGKGGAPVRRSAGGRYVFSYRIQITNQTPRPVQLLSRHWIIVDGDGERGEVQGEGVVGQQPVIAPGQMFEYSSFCPLRTPWGTMEGEYTFTSAGGADTGEKFAVAVARFYLVAEVE